MNLLPIAQALLGLAAFCALAWVLSENRRAVRVRPILAGIAVQLVLAALLLKLPVAREAFFLLNRLVLALESATAAGTSFVFGYLGGGPLPFEETAPGASFVLAFRALPLVLVISALSALFYHWRILPLVVRGFAWALRKTMGLGGAAGLGAAANIFVGMIEAPLFIRPYLADLRRGELFIVMTTGMATVAGTMMVLYASVLGPVLPEALGHILIASVISVPAAVTIARIMVPGDEAHPTSGAPAGAALPPSTDSNAMDALTRGTAEGVTLLMQIVAMLVVLVACVALVNQALGLLPMPGDGPLTLQRLLGYALAPLAWLMGIPWAEAATAGGLMGSKIILNEFIAYLELARLPEGALSPHSRLILVYAMCGFANFGSLGIMIGGVGALIPERRAEVVALGLRSIVSGNLATAMTGAVVGVL